MDRGCAGGAEKPTTRGSFYVDAPRGGYEIYAVGPHGGERLRQTWSLRSVLVEDLDGKTFQIRSSEEDGVTVKRRWLWDWRGLLQDYSVNKVYAFCKIITSKIKWLVEAILPQKTQS